MKHGLSLKSRIILVFSLISITLVGLSARLGYVTVKHIYLRQLKDQVNLLSKVLAEQLDIRFLDYVEPEVDNLAATYYRKSLKSLAGKMQFSKAFIFDSSLTILVGDTALASVSGLYLNQRDIYRLKPNQTGLSSPFKSSDGHWYLWAYYRISNQYYLGLQEAANQLSYMDELAHIFAGIGLIALIVVVLAGWFLARTLTKPIDRMVAFSEQIGQGQFRARPPHNIKGELTILRDSLLHMRDALLQRDEEKEHILAQIAHEIRNPLGGIELLAGLVREDVEPGSKQDAYIQKILKEVQGLKSQLNAYLNYSRPAVPHIREVSVRDIVQEVKNSYFGLLERKNIRLGTEIKTDTVLFDRQHLKQVISNLVANSIEAIGRDGHITVGTFRNGYSTYLTLSDDGPGIGEQDPEKIFEPFYTGKPEGTGLGLAICNKLCRENNARISVKNNEEKGCTFTVEIG